MGLFYADDADIDFLVDKNLMHEGDIGKLYLSVDYDDKEWSFTMVSGFHNRSYVPILCYSFLSLSRLYEYPCRK